MKKKTTTSRNPKSASARRRASTAAARAAAGEIDPLARYRGRRDFKKTPEPHGATKRRKGKAPIFVVQKHAASHLHYDFRLEIDGVLKSWAVPKGPPIAPADKRLAVATEDHPLDYAGFEGIIPEGEYGGGTVIVWDTGPFRNLKRDKVGGEIPLDRAHEMGQVEVWLEGEKLRGGYALVHSRLGGNERNWLLIKMKDPPGARRVRTVDADESVLSGRTLEEVARRRR